MSLDDSNNDLITSYTYNTENNPLTIKDPNGNIIANTYDSNSNLIETKTKITDINAQEMESIIKYSYDTN
jgi:YD repeat-containing protein